MVLHIMVHHSARVNCSVKIFSMPNHLHHTLPFLLNRIAAIVTDGANHAFQSEGLNVYAARVLILLYLDGEHSVGDLALQASLDQSTLSHILRRLEKQGLVKRTRKEMDNRSVVVSLTAEGKIAGSNCWDSVQMHDALLRNGLDTVNAVVLEKLLKRIYKNVPSFRTAQVPESEKTKLATSAGPKPAKTGTRKAQKV
jgi:DNA-binding MarR family transcriptional regulator